MVSTICRLQHALSVVNYRTITSSSVLYARNHFKKDAGISRRYKLFETDDPIKNEIEVDDDINDLESDFSSVDGAYDEMQREKYRNKKFTTRKITEKKFFSEPKQPNMLTWAERLQIQKLYKSDPEEWNLDVLAESFPATRSTISKILNSKWKPTNLQKMRGKDAKVRKNWALLAEGKLEAESELLEHLKKFLTRREDYLASINTEDFQNFFEKPKEEYNWNKGEMYSILESYENKLKTIEENRLLALNSGSKELIQNQPGEDINKDCTFEENLDPLSNLETNADNNSLNNHRNRKQETLITYSQLQKEISPDKRQYDDTDTREGRKIEKLTKRSATPNKMDEIQQKTISKTLLQMAGYSQSIETNIPNHEETKTKKYDRFQVAEEKHVNNLKLSSEDISSESISIKDSEESDKEEASLYQYSTDLERKEYEEEEQSIGGTYFWPSNEEKGEIIESLSQDKSLSLKELQKKAAEELSYLKRIKIPKGKRGSGLTFRVNDCFYDDDGEFLYRVPGMLANESSNSS